jgi:hypothetical protein
VWASRGHFGEALFDGLPLVKLESLAEECNSDSVCVACVGS